MTLSPSTKRCIRTAYQTLIALVVIVPVIVSGLPVAAQATAIVAAVGTVAKILNALEDARLIPAWLKSVPAEPEAATLPDGTSVVADPSA